MNQMFFVGKEFYVSSRDKQNQVDFCKKKPSDIEQFLCGFFEKMLSFEMR